MFYNNITCKKLKKIAVSLFFLLFFVNSALSETTGTDTLYIDLMTALEIAAEHSPDAILDRLTEENARLNYRSSVADNFFPRLDLAFLAPSFSESSQEDFVTVIDPVDSTSSLKREWTKRENMQWSGVVNLEQPLPTGGSINLESQVYRRLFRSDLTGVEDQEELNVNYRLELSHELLRGNNLALSRKKAKISYDKAKWAGQRSRRQLALNILESFYNLVMKERQLAITRDDLNASRETAEMARMKYEAGLIAEVEALQLELQVIEKQASLESEISDYENMMDQFRVTLGLDLEQKMKVIGEPEFKSEKVNLEDALNIAFDQREDLYEAETNVTLAKYSMKETKLPWNPSGRLNAYYDIDSKDDLNSDEDYDANNRGLTFSLSMPIWSSGRRKIAVQQAEIGLRQSKINKEETRKQVILEVRQAVRELDEAERRYQNSLRSLELAEKSNQITRDRFENGQVNAREWIEAQLSLKQNRINALQALVGHTLAVARYKMAIGDAVVDFEAKQASVIGGKNG